MALSFTKHALSQMKRRGISELDVELALRRQSQNPTPGEQGTIWRWGTTATGRTLKVCVKVDDAEFVITAAWPGN